MDTVTSHGYSDGGTRYSTVPRQSERRTATVRCSRSLLLSLLFEQHVLTTHGRLGTTGKVLTRPLEDVVLAMKAMQILNVASFLYPTHPTSRRLMPLSNNLLELVVSTSHTSREKVAMNMQPDSVLRWPNFHSACDLVRCSL